MKFLSKKNIVQTLVDNRSFGVVTLIVALKIVILQIVTFLNYNFWNRDFEIVALKS